MQHTVIFKTDKNNTYLYNNQYRISGLVHPDLKKMYDDMPESDVDLYYVQKYAYLKKYGFFNQREPVKYTSITAKTIKDGISQVSKIVFEVTEACDLMCTYCGYGDIYEIFDKREYHKIDIEKAKKFLDYVIDLKLKSNGSYVMIGFYGGEPLLNMTFVREIVDYIQSLNIKSITIEYSTTTNATLIHKYIDFLVENKFHILISLDGDDKGDSYRVYKDKNKPSFYQVIRNIDMIQKNYPEYFSKYISFNAVLHNRNSVRSIYEFIYKKYHKIPSISELISSNVKTEKKDNFKILYNSLRNSELEYFSNKYEVLQEARLDSVFYNDVKNFLKYTHVDYFIWNALSLLMKEQIFLPSNTCLPFSLKIFLTSHNRLLPCERVNHKYYLGEVRNSVEINIEEIAAKYNSYYRRIEKLCQKCYLYRYCGKCLYQIQNIENPNKALKCDKFCNQEKFAAQLSSLFSYMELYPEDYMRVLEEE